MFFCALAFCISRKLAGKNDINKLGEHISRGTREGKSYMRSSIPQVPRKVFQLTKISFVFFLKLMGPEIFTYRAHEFVYIIVGGDVRESGIEGGIIYKEST
jgi:hypothetical protein